MSNPTCFLVLLGGELTVTDRLRSQTAGARVIAADGGMAHAEALGVTPELWVGDFDSTPEALAQRWPHIERMPFPDAKNNTDGELAVEAALTRGATEVIMAGALGGERSDHALQHLVYACWLQQSGHRILVTSGLEEAVPLAIGRQSFDLPERSLFSILAFSDLTGITIENVRYPLDDFDMPFGSSRTISNVALGPITIGLKSGTAILMARPFDMSGR